MWSGAHNPTVSNTSGRFVGSDDGSNAKAVAHQRAVLSGLRMGVGNFNLGLTSPTLRMLSRLNMAQVAQLNGMNPFNTNMLSMANLSVMGISPKVPLLEAGLASLAFGSVRAVVDLVGCRAASVILR